MCIEIIAEGYKRSKKKLKLPGNIPHIDDIYQTKNISAFLLCGSHKKETDSMIITIADDEQKKLTLISIPRDLYYKGRKINHIYFLWGVNQLLRELSDITGIEIKHYLMIDMFAFIDAINIVGGIDIILDQDLVDPSYKIKENGKWDYLSYKKGAHHLDGIQALRVARSRNCTSDFSRARRQQQLIEALNIKFKSLSIVDMGRIYALIGTLVKYIDTNLSPFEMAGYLSKFRDYRVSSQNVLDTSNILYFTYSNIYLMKNKNEEQKKDPVGDQNNGAYILLPRNDDWNLIRWYIRELIMQ